MLIFISLISANLLVIAGLYGALSRRDNLIITMICLEVSLLGVALLFAFSGLLFEDAAGLLMFFMLLMLAAVESALGLALIINYYRVKTSIRWSLVPALRG